MFELEEYSSGYHDGFLNKYADSDGPNNLDFYVSDSMQDMINVDIRAEIAHVIGGNSDINSTFENTLETAINNNSSTNSTLPASANLASTSSNIFPNSTWHTSPTAKWMGSTWTGDYLADLGACVNPISVMPLISSSFMQNTRNGSTSPPPSLVGERDPTKSHLTFSPAQMKISAGSLRREQVHAHIPKQIVTISSAVTGGTTTAPATLATNSVLQRKSVGPAAAATAAVDAVRKDLKTELRRVSGSINGGNVTTDESKKNSLLSVGTATNTIKLGPGIGGLTFANSITYNKLKQQNVVAKSIVQGDGIGSPIIANSTVVLKRERDSSSLQQHNMTTLGGSNQISVSTKRNLVQPTNNYTPKSIASSAHSPHFQNGGGNHASSNSVGSPLSTSSSSMSSAGNASPFHGIGNGNSFSGLTPLSNTSNLVNIANNNGVGGNGNNSNSNSNAIGNSNSNSNGNIAVKPLHQKIKLVHVEPQYPKPAYSYSCLIAMALKNSRSGSLPVSEIYSFMCEHFPYFKNAPSGWKNSVRHNLSLNKCFEKIEKPASNGNQRKGCLWAMNPERIVKMDEEVQKWSRKDPNAIRIAMVFPEHLEALERGEMKHGSADSDVELDSQSEIEETSDLEEQDFDDTLVDNMLVEEEEEEDDEEVEEDDIIDIDDVPSNSRLRIEHNLLRQKQAEFDIEIDDDMYDDEIEVDEDLNKATTSKQHHQQLQQQHIIEINPADLHEQHHHHLLQQQQHHHLQQGQQHGSVGGYMSPKRGRFDVNYSIGHAGELEKQMLPQQQNYKKVIVQTAQSHHQQQLQHQQQQIVVQTINAPQQQQHQQQFQQFNTFIQQQNNRRKMQLKFTKQKIVVLTNEDNERKDQQDQYDDDDDGDVDMK